MQTLFQRRANIMKILALEDLDSGRCTLPELKERLQRYEKQELFEICEGFRQAIKIYENEKELLENPCFSE